MAFLPISNPMSSENHRRRWMYLNWNRPAADFQVSIDHAGQFANGTLQACRAGFAPRHPGSVRHQSARHRRPPAVAGYGAGGQRELRLASFRMARCDSWPCWLWLMRHNHRRWCALKSRRMVYIQGGCLLSSTFCAASANADSRAVGARKCSSIRIHLTWWIYWNLQRCC